MSILRMNAGGRREYSPLVDWGSDLKLWMDFSDGNTVTQASNAISAVTDKSGNGNTGNQATAAKKPTWQADATTGLYCASFDGGDVLTVTDHTSLTMATGCTMMFAVDLTSMPAYGYLFNKQNAGTDTQSYRASCNVDGSIMYFYVNTFNTRVSTSLTGRHIFEFVYDKVNIKAYKDGTIDGTTAYTANAVDTANDLQIGDYNGTGGTYSFTGKMFEILMAETDVGTAKKDAARAYLKRKWNTS